MNNKTKPGQGVIPDPDEENENPETSNGDAPIVNDENTEISNGENPVVNQEAPETNIGEAPIVNDGVEGSNDEEVLIVNDGVVNDGVENEPSISVFSEKQQYLVTTNVWFNKKNCLKGTILELTFGEYSKLSKYLEPFDSSNYTESPILNDEVENESSTPDVFEKQQYLVTTNVWFNKKNCLKGTILELTFGEYSKLSKYLEPILG